MASEAESRIAGALRSSARTLDLCYLDLTALPESLRQLTGLTRLYVDGNSLVALPEWIGELTGLVNLGLKGNALTALPDSLRNLTRLTHLRLDGNRLASLPESIGDLVLLERLCLADNRLVALPAGLARLQRLVQLSLGGDDSSASAPLGHAVARLPPGQRLLAHIGARGRLRELALRSFDDPSGRTLAAFLSGPFPPPATVPAIPDHLLPTVLALALGRPGDPVEYGYFPRRETKLARLALARSRQYPAAVVLKAAEHAYDRNRDGELRAYHAHDALACALVHPDVNAAQLLARYTAHGRAERGHRSRHKTHQLSVWARQYGYLPDTVPCPCGHQGIAVPSTRQEALALAGHWNRISGLLTVVERDPHRWLALLRCSRCHRLWAEDSITSGHAALFFGYPLGPSDPHDWLADAVPLDL